MQRRIKSTQEYDAEIARGNEAVVLLSNVLLNKTLEKIEADATTRMIESFKQEERDLAWHEIRSIRALKAQLQSLADTGRIARDKKDQLKDAE